MWALHGLLAEVWALAVVLALKPRVCDVAHLVMGRMGQPGLMGGVGVFEGVAALGVWGGPVLPQGALGWRLEPEHSALLGPLLWTVRPTSPSADWAVGRGHVPPVQEPLMRHLVTINPVMCDGGCGFTVRLNKGWSVQKQQR